MSDLRELIAAYLDDGLTDADRDQLTSLLKGHPDNLRAFVDANLFEQHLRTVVTGQVRREATGEWPESGRVRIRQAADSDGPGVKPWLPRRWPRLVAVGAAALLLIATGISVWVAYPPAQDRELARITRIRSAQVSGPVDSLRTGQALGPGRLTLIAGAMEIVLTNGVTLVFEGPGQMELLTPMRVLLHSGQAVVRVPRAARGFRLETAGAQVVDLGTEFGVKCGPAAVTDVQVFQGKVMASSASGGAGFPQELAAGQATRFSPDQSLPTSIAFRPERFVRRLPPDRGIEIEDHDFPFNQPSVEEISIFAATQPVVVDGDFSEWSRDGLFRGERGNGRFLEGRMRYDAEFLFVAAHIGDPTPLRNMVDPATDAEFGWRGGGLQIRIAADPALGWPVNANAAAYYQMRELTVDAVQLARATNPALAHLTLWHYAPTAQNCLHIAYGMDLHGAVVNPPGFRAAMRPDAAGRGYTLEYAIPWRLLNAPRAPRPDDTLAMSWTAHWSDASGRLWRGQLVELRNAAEPLRIHTWERAATWGRAVFH